MSDNSYDARATLEVGDRKLDIFRLDALQAKFDVARLPFSLKVLLENLLRTEGNGSVTAKDIEALATLGREGRAEQGDRVHARARRDAGLHRRAGRRRPRRDARRDGRPRRRPGEDQPARPGRARHRPLGAGRRTSARATRSRATPSASSSATRSATRSCAGARTRSTTSRSSRRTPASSTRSTSSTSRASSSSTTSAGVAYPDTLVGTDSHTTMINGLGVLGWGVGGIEAEAAMLGQPMSMLIPQVHRLQAVGRAARGRDRDRPRPHRHRACCARKGVVGKFVEFYGPGVSALPLADRATIGNMSPEFGSTCAIFPIDRETLRYLEFSGRPKELIDLVEAYAKEQGLWHDENSRGADVLRHGRARPVRGRAVARRPEAPAGPRAARRGEGRASARRSPSSSARTTSRRSPTAHDEAVAETFPASDPPANGAPGHEASPATGRPSAGASPPARASPSARRRRSTSRSTATTFKLDHGHVVIAAITSCTNTSNPSVMLGAGLLARNARARGLERQPWVKTSLAPGSKVVTEYLKRSGPRRAARRARLQPRRLRLHDVHRELRAAAGRDLGGGQRGRPRGRARCSAATATSRGASTPT